MPARTAIRPLRIDLLHPTFWPEALRGAERIVADLALGLAARGHQPRLITSHPGSPRRSRVSGVRVIRHWRPPDRLLRERGRPAHLTHVPLTYATLRTGRADVVHALFHTDALAAARWSERTGRPSVYTSMGIPSNAWLDGPRGLRAIVGRAATHCDAAVVLSTAAAHGFAESVGMWPRVIHPGVDLTAFTPGQARHPQPTLLCTAALDDPRKRVGLLLEAFALVRSQRPEVRIVVIRPRDASLAEQLEAAGAELRPPGSDPASLVEAYREAWLCVLPARDEAFGLVSVEALACGTPIVVAADGGGAEIVDSQSVGRIFESGHAEALAESLLSGLTLASHPGTGTACRTRAEVFGTEGTTSAYLALYEELIMRRKLARDVSSRP